MKWVDEFREFHSAEEVGPPQVLTERILENVKADLNPPGWFVFSKVSLVHLLVGSLTLLICPQLGVGPFKSSLLMAIFMRLGHEVCTFACGALFIGASALVASLVLRPEEVRVVRRSLFRQVATLSALSFVAFLCLGASVVTSLGAIWILGAVAGGAASLELGWLLRSRLRG